jgi:hypothetical protein
MKMSYTLIVPAIAETQITGFRLAAEKTVRNTVWRIEYHSNETYPRFYKRKEGTTAPGTTIPLARVTERMAKFANSVTKTMAIT